MVHGLLLRGAAENMHLRSHLAASLFAGVRGEVRVSWMSMGTSASSGAVFFRPVFLLRGATWRPSRWCLFRSWRLCSRANRPALGETHTRVHVGAFSAPRAGLTRAGAAAGPGPGGLALDGPERRGSECRRRALGYRKVRDVRKRAEMGTLMCPGVWVLDWTCLSPLAATLRPPPCRFGRRPAGPCGAPNLLQHSHLAEGSPASAVVWFSSPRAFTSSARCFRGASRTFELLC